MPSEKDGRQTPQNNNCSHIWLPASYWKGTTSNMVEMVYCARCLELRQFDVKDET